MMARFLISAMQQETHVNLSIEIDHPLITREVYALLEAVIMHEREEAVDASSGPTDCQRNLC